MNTSKTISPDEKGLRISQMKRDDYRPANKTKTIQVESKAFAFTMGKNSLGQFLRITETAGDRRNSIMIPEPGLAEFKRMLDLMVDNSAQTPSKS